MNDETTGQTPTPTDATKKNRKPKAASKYAVIDAEVFGQCYGRAASIKECRKLAEQIIPAIEGDNLAKIDVAIVCIRERLTIERTLQTTVKRVKG